MIRDSFLMPTADTESHPSPQRRSPFDTHISWPRGLAALSRTIENSTSSRTRSVHCCGGNQWPPEPCLRRPFQIPTEAQTATPGRPSRDPPDRGHQPTQMPRSISCTGRDPNRGSSNRSQAPGAGQEPSAGRLVDGGCRGVLIVIPHVVATILEQPHRGYWAGLARRSNRPGPASDTKSSANRCYESVTIRRSNQLPVRLSGGTSD